MTVSVQNSPFKVLVIGGSYAGISAALNLIDLCTGKTPRCGAKVDDSEASKIPINVDVTIVDERDGFFHIIGAPLALASNSYAEKAWVKYSDIAALQLPNIHIVQGTAKTVDPATKTATITRTEPAATAAQTSSDEIIPYDFLVAASGLRRVWPVVPQSLRRKQYLVETGSHVQAVSGARNGVLVVGGGAVGIEMAAELKLVQPHVRVTLAHSRDRLLSSEALSDECKDVALRLLREAGVEVLMGHRIAEQVELTTEDGCRAVEARFENGHRLVVDKVIMAISKSVPSSTYLPLEALDAEGYVKIQPSLAFPPSVPNAEYHFAPGDLALWSGIKRCGGAMHMGFCAATNMHQLMLQQMSAGQHTSKPIKLREFPPMIGLAVGKKAVSYSPDAGTNSGEDVNEMFFGNDLGFSICWNYLRLGGDKETDKI
ncbi:hypothetical protein PpBr36_02136 [Pyricularia pennisetigena]|uniref:hypothetical protein n=1 Tax=Pyricularia pennisetigena TaxID=1578925 RepID=UPI0011521059|nr:hypothetical protein PpBr36_02136 [Pyricularia pennisetigena]TLS29427.1 hypothetical protein PpBr36_02136 [Pyricularia pennisetigena]